LLVWNMCTYYQEVGDPLNNMIVDKMTTPESIRPEWYYNGYFALLRVVPDKALGIGVLVLYLVWLGSIARGYSKGGEMVKRTGSSYRWYWLSVSIVGMLFVVGSQGLSSPLLIYGQWLLHLVLVGMVLC